MAPRHVALTIDCPKMTKPGREDKALPGNNHLHEKVFGDKSQRPTHERIEKEFYTAKSLRVTPAET